MTTTAPTLQSRNTQGFTFTHRAAFMLALGLTSSLLALPVQADETPVSRPQAQTVARQVCVACHGPGGRATSPLFPHLAGQTAQYIAGELRAFKRHARSESEARDYMWGIAERLDEPMIEALAAYYADQPAPARDTNTETLAKTGETLFRQGATDHGIPACASCHGAQGEGQADIPRIAAQQTAYIARQMREIRAGERAAPTMQVVLRNMNDTEIDSLANYLSGR